MSYKKNKRKYTLGVQQVMIPEKGSVGDIAGNTLGIASTGAKLGSTLGPIGGAVGGLVGGVAGLTKGLVDNSIQNRERNEALRLNKYIIDNERSEDPQLQMWQAEDGANMQSTKKIEVEKDELVFKKGNSGKYKLKADFKGGKTHEAGGEPYIAEKGDVIFPGHMRDKIMKAYKSGNTALLESIRFKLPKDTNVAKNGLDEGDPYTPIVNTDPYFNFPQGDDGYVGPGQHDNELGGTLLDLRTAPVETQTFEPKIPGSTYNNKYSPQKVAVPNITSNTTKNNSINIDPNLSKVIQAAPTIYNNIQGTFGKIQNPARRYMKSDKYRYTDTSAPLIQASNQQQTIDMANANRTIGSRAQALSYMSQAGVANYARKSGIIADQINRKTSINNANVDLTNADKQMNLQLANQYDTQYLQNKAKKTEYLGKGLEGASALSQNDELMKNLKNRDKLLSDSIKTSNYGFESSLGLTGYYAPDGSFVSGNKTYIKSGSKWIQKYSYGTQGVNTKYKYK